MTGDKIIQESFDFSDDEEEEQVKILPSVQGPTPSKIYYKSSRIYHEEVKKATEEQVFIEPVTKTAPIVVSAPPQAAAPPPPPFGIVLVNIKKAAEDRHIHCEHRLLDGQTPYVALSYRWGELDEQMIPATEDYNARIISFQLQDFFKLCQTMVHEPDLQHIEYVWVDAICVNQDNMEKRKATIYRMNDIYIHATAIVAVPDLHALHLATTSTANSDCMAIVKRYRRYLYYLLVGTPEAQQSLVDMDHAWMDALGIPPLHTHRRDLVHSNNARRKKMKQQNSDRTTNSNSDLLDNQAVGDPTGFIQQMMTLMTMPSQLQDMDDPHAKAEHYQQLTCRMMTEFQQYDWQQKMDQRKTDVIKSMQFLQSVMEDWSNRTWVISEYHIAKRKDGKLKFWYNQLSCPELHGLRFFEFDFGKQQPQQPATATTNEESVDLRQQHPYTSQIIYLSRKFKGSMRRRLTKRSVLEMMLQTRASKPIDRFHSIIPLAPKYKHHIKDRNCIAEWGISNMLSVKLKLMEWMDTKDRLYLLYSARHPPASASPFLPTFATHLKTVRAGLLKLILHYPQCNFDLQSSDTVRLVRPPPPSPKDEQQQEQVGLEELWLCPRMYYARSTNKSYAKERSFYQEMGGKDNRLWEQLGLDPAKDSLDAVSIPLFRMMMEKEDDDQEVDASTKNLLALDIQLVGSWEKNVWVLYQFCSNYKDGKIHPSRLCPMDNQQLPDGFRVY